MGDSPCRKRHFTGDTRLRSSSNSRASKNAIALTTVDRAASKTVLLAAAQIDRAVAAHAGAGAWLAIHFVSIQFCQLGDAVSADAGALFASLLMAHCRHPGRRPTGPVIEVERTAEKAEYRSSQS
jgi:hypothetical protein